jgi:hypothetical protein
LRQTGKGFSGWGEKLFTEGGGTDRGEKGKGRGGDEEEEGGEGRKKRKRGKRREKRWRKRRGKKRKKKRRDGRRKSPLPPPPAAGSPKPSAVPEGPAGSGLGTSARVKAYEGGRADGL